jgi:restriction endonuclease
MTGVSVNALPESTKAYFIKLGEGGTWESSCLSEGTIRFGYHATPQDLCVQGQWERVRAFWAQRRAKEGTATNDARQIRTFFEASEDDIFVTFSKSYLWWCRPYGVPVFHSAEDGSRLRQTVDGWRNTSIGGEPLLVSRLSGKLTKTQMYQGTICEVEERAYLLRRINDQQTPEVLEAEATEQILTKQILAMIRLLTPKDFELMVELIFSRSGWQRQSSTGGSQKTVDLDLLLPTTRERAFVQVKSRTNTAQFEKYAAEFAATDAHARMFYVWHTGTVDRAAMAGITLWGPNVIGSKVLDAGLLAWLKDRVS